MPGASGSIQMVLAAELKRIHKQQRNMIALLEQFEDLLWDAQYRSKSSNLRLSALFLNLQDCIDAHLKFENEHLLPLLHRSSHRETVSALMQQRKLILRLIQRMSRAIDCSEHERFGVCAWEDFIESALSLIRATFALFHWEEVAFLLPSKRA